MQAIVTERLPASDYLLCDDEAIATTEMVQLMGKVLNKKVAIWNIPRPAMKLLAAMGSVVHAPFNSLTLEKLTENMIVSNAKLKRALGEPLPVSAMEGLGHTIKSFNG
ncbi:MAG: hypothetical protein HC819_16040 [Cyclobacteriaceae bacterium]|nr:hypothetical protein [Cyclobacteriaceae bacterium]